MTREEAKKIVMVIASTYPNWHPLDMSFTVNAWASMLESFTYQEISAALKAFILSDTSGFAPSVGQIIGLLDRVGNSQEPNEMEAWTLVSNALRRSTYYAESEFDKLPEIVQRAVGSPKWELKVIKRPPVGRSDFYGYRRRFYYNLDCLLRTERGNASVKERGKG